MGGQVMGGGVIVFVAVALWLVYLLPSWNNRYKYDAAERNAVRMNQALRVLAETSETPDEVRLELNARTALAQHKLARKAQAQRESAARRSQAEHDQLARQTRHAQEQGELERARRDLAVARATPEARRSRARRRARLFISFVGFTAVAVAAWGVWDLIATGSQLWLWAAGVVGASSAILLTRIARVGARATVRPFVADSVPVSTAQAQDFAMAEGLQRGQWSPRRLPQPLTASAGSRAAAVLDGVAAREALASSRREEALLARTQRQRPPSIATARIARASAEASALASQGVAGDAEIEAHVRQLLTRRAAG